VRRAVGIALALAAFPVAGCGGASGAGSNASDSTAASGKSTAAASARAKHSTQPVGRDIVRNHGDHTAKARGVGSEPNDEVNASGAKTQKPCALVRRSEAEAIIGKPIAESSEAPQGPTCIYRPRGAKSFITLAVESRNFSKLEPQSQLRNRMSVTVGGHPAYCGGAGGPMLIVPLSGGKFIAVAAPCPIAASFAAKALRRLSD
jgi:predicted small secreted protein